MVALLKQLDQPTAENQEIQAKPQAPEPDRNQTNPKWGRF